MTTLGEVLRARLRQNSENDTGEEGNPGFTHTIIHDGRRLFKVTWDYPWTEGWVMGMGKGWSFDSYSPDDMDLLVLSWT